jgi:hypothetical protein
MEVFKTYLFFDDYDQGHSYLIDTIFYDDAWWLVASWMQKHMTTEKIPARLVRLTGLAFQEVEDNKYRFLLNNAIPKSVLDGREQDGYTTLFYPDALSHIQGNSGVH